MLGSQKITIIKQKRKTEVKRFMTISAGLDVHKDKCHGVIMDEDGEILRDEKFENSLAGVQEFFKGFKHADVVMESSYSWRPTYE
ncbi:hypothetical protein AKJ37_07515, partial [candidate division MSBL1 archaeon SCGC-AAA259I09]